VHVSISEVAYKKSRIDSRARKNSSSKQGYYCCLYINCTSSKWF